MGLLERVRLTALNSLQLLMMLEVMQAWTRADAEDLSEAARQAHADLIEPDDDEGADPAERERQRQRALALIEQIPRKLERLAQLAPLQSQDAQASAAVQGGLRRLGTANESVLRVLQALAPSARPAEAAPAQPAEPES
ncbi:hypothetical protein PGB34_14665 [Xenophilus arseniciresistens]|uniref:Uncharacterized protein n=1 Tax=Xenophilus arseniciresistens TaxID=1283306 RepID=A0AAE3SZW2_9BURK|nr:hypothetical protein [Xenophilus arseniciresistens]MDA7417602.1 hypothetical protein [Xenophilus arseniciresistens]